MVKFPGAMAAAVMVGAAFLSACNDDNNSASNGSVADIAEEAQRSVVRVGVNCPPESPLQCEGAGSGWFYDDEGHIVTNNHVVTLGGQLQTPGDVSVLTHDGRVLQVEVIGRDEQTDLAVLEIDGDVDYPSLGHGSLEETRIGEPVVAIGYALDLGPSPSVTTGVVSAKERRIVEATTGIFGALQTDAAINPGNSGGPLLNMEGEAIGVNTAQARQAQAIGFAVSIETVVAVVSELLDEGEVQRGFLGIAFQDVTSGMASDMDLPVEEGVRVEEVGPGTPAEAAGIEQGDIIVEVAGEEISQGSDVPLALIGHPPGDTVEIGLYRDGDEMTVEVELGETPSF